MVTLGSVFTLPGGEGGGLPLKEEGMLVISLRCVNFMIWSRLGCSGQNTISRKSLF